MRDCLDGKVNGDIRGAVTADPAAGHLRRSETLRRSRTPGRGRNGTTIKGAAGPINLPVDKGQPQ